MNALLRSLPVSITATVLRHSDPSKTSQDLAVIGLLLGHYLVTSKPKEKIDFD
jgi:hypothetical protein